MTSSGMLRRVPLVITGVSEERVFSLQLLVTVDVPSCPIFGGSTFLRNVGSYKSHKE
jgi:hypothetical protein